MIGLMKDHIRTRDSQRGFTLIELLIVITILGVLSGVVLFAVQGSGDRGKAAAYAEDARTLRTAQEVYCGRFGEYGSEDQLAGLADAPDGQRYKFIGGKSTYHEISLSSGGNCDRNGGANSAFTLTRIGVESSTTIVNVAANQDQWIVSDSNSGPGYHSSAFAYPLNGNVYDPLIIIGSNYTLLPGLATSWEAIPIGTDRATFTSANNPVALPLPPHDPYVNAADRPYNTTTWRFHLRQGVTFHDGSTFDADDVIWTWRDRQPVNASPLSTVTNTLGFTLKRSGVADRWDSVEKIDQYTVDITPKTQNLRLPEQIGHPKGAIVPATGTASFANTPNLSTPRTVGKHFDGSTDGKPATVWWNGTASTADTTTTALVTTNYDAVGTGPFQLDAYAPTNPQGGGTAATLRWDNHWGQKALVKGMSFTFIADATTRANGLLSGAYDMVIDLDPLSVAAVTPAIGSVRTAAHGQNALIYVNKVVKDTPSTAPNPATFGGDIPTDYRYNIGTDPAVRKAVSLAIDRPTYVNSVYAGNAAPGRWMGPPNILGTHQNDVAPLSFNAALARTTLDNAGWTCGGGAPGAGTACAANETRAYNGTNPAFTAGRPLRLDLIGTPDIPQTGYDFLTDAMRDVGIDLHATRFLCNSTPCALGPARSSRYASVFWDLDLELPNQNDANPAFLPTLRFACTRSNTFRFSPPDGTNGIGPAVNDTAANGGGTFPFGNTPCDPIAGQPSIQNPGATSVNTTAAVLGPFDKTYVPAADNATTQDAAQAAAAFQMKILVTQDQFNVGSDVVPPGVVIPVTGQYRIYGLKAGFNLGDPHPSQTSQRWITLSKS